MDKETIRSVIHRLEEEADAAKKQARTAEAKRDRESERLKSAEEQVLKFRKASHLHASAQF